MNVKKTALATTIALTMAGGSAWAETTTVRGQFIVDRLSVAGGESVNLALLGLNKDGEVDRYGEEKGSKIMAVVQTVKGTIVRDDPDEPKNGSDRPGSYPNDPLPGVGNFASEVGYVELNQGVGRVFIEYSEEIVDTENTTDILTVFLQERIPTGEGGVRFERIGQPIEKTITITPSTKEPTSFSLTSFSPPEGDPVRGNNPNLVYEPNSNGELEAQMTVGYRGGTLEVWGNEDFEEQQTRAAIFVTLKVVDSNGGEVVHSDRQRMIRNNLTFSLTSEIRKAGLYYLVVLLEGKEDEVNNLRLIKKDTLRIWPRKTPEKALLTSNKTRIALAHSNQFVGGSCNGSQVCQGAEITLTLLDQYGNVITPYTDQTSAMTIDVKDSLRVVANKTVTLGARQISTSWTVGDHADELIKTGIASLVASASELPKNSEVLRLRVVNGSLKGTTYADPEINFDFRTDDQKAGTEFYAFKVVITNNQGVTLMNAANATLTRDPGKIILTSSTGETVEINRQLDPPKRVDAVEVYFEKVTPTGRYLLSDKDSQYGQVWVEAGKIVQAAAQKVTLHNAIGDEITSIRPVYIPDDRRYVAELPEVSLRMTDAYDNVITENVGDFNLKTANTAKIEYVGTAGPNFGQVGHSGGLVEVVYDPIVFSGDDKLTLTFNKPALSNKTLVLTTTIPGSSVEDLADIDSHIETTDIPVNSEVAFQVETLDKEGKLLQNKNVVLITTFNTEEDALAEIDLPGEDPDYVITPVIYDGPDSSKRVSSGGRLTFEEGRKLLVIEAGPRPGKFSITFTDVNNPEITHHREFTVTNDIQIVAPLTEEECLNNGNLWKVDGSTTECQDMVDLTVGGAFMMGTDGIAVEKTARITGGTSIDGGKIASRARANLSDESEIGFVGNIAFAPAHDDEEVDIIALALYQPNPLLTGIGGGTYFVLGEGGLALPWNDPTNLAGITSFYDEKHTIIEGEPKVVEIYKGKFEDPPFIASTLDVWLGYRLDDGTIVFNPESIHVTLLP